MSASATEQGAGPQAAKPKGRGTPLRRRRRSGTARYHLSAAAVDTSVADIIRLTDAQCLERWVQVRFGGWDNVRCCHCGSTCRHYWRPLQKRWKCKGCDKTFSVTSGTVFSHRKRSLQALLADMLMFMNSSAGQPALELRRHSNISYNSAFTIQHKLREGLVRSHNVGLLAGDLEMDGAHQSGWQSAERRGKPQITQPVTSETPEPEVRSTMLTQCAQIKERRNKKPREPGAVDPEYGRMLPKDRRMLIVVRKRSGERGRGALATRVAIGLVESPSVVKHVLDAFTAIPESALNTDTSTAYTSVGKRFRDHRKVEHSKMFSGPNGENNNQAESLNWRFDRAEGGVYLNLEPKYLFDYAVEIAFREDTRRMSNGAQVSLLLAHALAVGPSQFWRGFTRGRHRTVELMIPVPQPAPSSGPAKGRSPISSANGRPPR